LNSEDVWYMVVQKLNDTTQRELADELGVSASYLNDYLHFRREPGAKLLEALGLQRVVTYERAPPNARVDRPDAALSRQVRSDDGLCHTGEE